MDRRESDRKTVPLSLNDGLALRFMVNHKISPAGLRAFPECLFQNCSQIAELLQADSGHCPESMNKYTSMNTSNFHYNQTGLKFSNAIVKWPEQSCLAVPVLRSSFIPWNIHVQ